MSEGKRNLDAALLECQKEAPALQRDKLNPAFKGTSYLSLEALLEEVVPLLNKHGLVVSQWPSFVETETGAVHPTLDTMLIHPESGERETRTMLILPAQSTPQGQGAAITYAKRYALMAALGLSADADTDGQQKAPSRQRKAPGKISATQRRELMEVARENGVPTDRVLAIMKEVADVEKSEDIPTAKFAEVKKAIVRAKA